jgi:hypothetical protein
MAIKTETYVVEKVITRQKQQEGWRGVLERWFMQCLRFAQVWIFPPPLGKCKQGVRE